MATSEGVPQEDSRLTVVPFDLQGMRLPHHQVVANGDDSLALQWVPRLRRLARDLELPMELALPGDQAGLRLRICASPTAAYTLYYQHEEPLFASLLLTGGDEPTETELQQSFKYLLLDVEDDDEPEEEVLAAMEAAEEFDFAAIEERPVLFQIPFVLTPDSPEPVQRIPEWDQSLAAAFLAVSDVSPWQHTLAER